MASKKMSKASAEDAKPIITPDTDALVRDLKELIDEARSAVAATVNVGLTLLYWQVGKRVNTEILKGGRAEYGKGILATVSQQLTEAYGQGFSYSALTRMMTFSEVFPEREIVATLSQTLSWSHFRELLALKKPLQREFYAEMCRIEQWDVRSLRKKIDGMLYERTALSKKPDDLIRLRHPCRRISDGIATPQTA